MLYFMSVCQVNVITRAGVKVLFSYPIYSDVPSLNSRDGCLSRLFDLA